MYPRCYFLTTAYCYSSNSLLLVNPVPDNEVPIKVLLKIDLPLSAESYMEVVDPKNMEVRKKWDRAFGDHEIVKTYPDNQGFIVYLSSSTPWRSGRSGIVASCCFLHLPKKSTGSTSKPTFWSRRTRGIHQNLQEQVAE